MNPVKSIYNQDELVAQVFNLKDIEEGLDFLTEDDSFVQVGTWNYKKDTLLPAHFHNDFDRSALRTQEVVIVLSGKIKCSLYSTDGNFIDDAFLNQNMMIIQYSNAHEYELLEDSKVIEIKNGPYFGPDKDRTRINVEKN